jgi:hypothetical protein
VYPSIYRVVYKTTRKTRKIPGRTSVDKKQGGETTTKRIVRREKKNIKSEKLETKKTKQKTSHKNGVNQ